MAGGMTLFKNTVTGFSGQPATGIHLAGNASIKNLIYTYVAGRGDLQVPEIIDTAIYLPSFEDAITQRIIRDSSNTLELARSVGGYSNIFEIPPTFGLNAGSLLVSATDIFLVGFHDGFFQPDHNKLFW